MSTERLSPATVAGGAVFALSVVAFLALRWGMDAHRNVLAIPATIGWAGALVALFPLVKRSNRSALYFAFAIMALMIFFLHETYGYTGQVRLFPLIVGYTGIVLSTLDILSLTETRIGQAVSRFFGAALSAEHAEGRKPLREIAVIVAICSSVLFVWLFGFLIAGPVFVFLWMLLWGRKSIRACLYGSIGTLLFIWVLFQELMDYELYQGIVVMHILDMIRS